MIEETATAVNRAFARPVQIEGEDDIRFAGLICEWADAGALTSRSWVSLTATIAVRHHDCYDRVGPVLNGLRVETAQTPEDEVATFY